MQAVEFTTELSSKGVLSIPKEALARLPHQGYARVIVLTELPPSASSWQAGAYEQFMCDDAPEDAIYDNYLDK
jgi:predicted phosphohydrolase